MLSDQDGACLNIWMRQLQLVLMPEVDMLHQTALVVIAPQFSSGLYGITGCLLGLC